MKAGFVVSTDELASYDLLTGDGYTHGTVQHGKRHSYFDYRQRVTHHVDSVEGFWRLFKALIRSTHVAISGKHMQRYLDDFTFRANRCERVNGMFDDTSQRCSTLFGFPY